MSATPELTVPGSFAREAGSIVKDAVVLKSTRIPPSEITFTQVRTHDLPRRLEDVTLQPLPGKSGFEVRSQGRSFRVEATAVQVHEPSDIYGRSIQLARFRWRTRLLWTVVLTIARYDWGQALIRRLRR